jgi:Galactosyltransferase
MKPLIAVISNQRGRSATTAQRATWAIPTCGIDVRFFYGRGFVGVPLSDEIVLDVPDDYLSLVFKVHEAFKWAKANGYTHVFKVDDDTYVIPKRLLKNKCFDYDYFGSYRTADSYQYPHGYMHGGAGYGIGAAALDLVVNATPVGRSEDGWVGSTVFGAGKQGVNDSRIVYKSRVYGEPLPDMQKFYREGISLAEFAPQEMTRVRDGLLMATPLKEKDKQHGNH